MRIWSVHPEYLDSRGLVALWREALLAKHVLEGKTKGYKKHPQLERFRKSANPENSINQYLSEVYNVAVKRGFNFDKEKINWDFNPVRIPVTEGQLRYETGHLKRKLKIRDKARYNDLKDKTLLRTHPLFRIVEGKIETWEKIQI